MKKKLIALIILLSLSLSVYASEEECRIYIAQSDQTDFSDLHCTIIRVSDDEFKKMYILYEIKDFTLGQLQPGIQCELIGEDKTTKNDMFNCGSNDLGIPNSAFYRTLHLNCRDIGPAPSYPILRTWVEDRDTFDACVPI